MNATIFNPCSDKQIAFIKTLAEGNGRTFNDDFNWTLISVKQASMMIEGLIAEKKTLAAKAAASAPKLVEGMYIVDGTVYKVQYSKSSGKPYAKRLVALHTPKVLKTKTVTHGFEYAPGAIYKIKPEHRMTIEDAASFGLNTGTCCVCGALLTNDKSVKSGIGPVCAKKF